jgi:hypothetical protein
VCFVNKITSAQTEVKVLMVGMTDEKLHPLFVEILRWQDIIGDERNTNI